MILSAFVYLVGCLLLTLSLMFFWFISGGFDDITFVTKALLVLDQTKLPLFFKHFFLPLIAMAVSFWLGGVLSTERMQGKKIRVWQMITIAILCGILVITYWNFRTWMKI